MTHCRLQQRGSGPRGSSKKGRGEIRAAIWGKQAREGRFALLHFSDHGRMLSSCKPEEGSGKHHCRPADYEAPARHGQPDNCSGGSLAQHNTTVHLASLLLPINACAAR